MRGRAKRAQDGPYPPLDSENETETNTAAHTSRARRRAADAERCSTCAHTHTGTARADPAPQWPGALTAWCGHTRLDARITGHALSLLVEAPARSRHAAPCAHPLAT